VVEVEVELGGDAAVRLALKSGGFNVRTAAPDGKNRTGQARRKKNGRG
jgi:hypothetical protein